MSDGVSYKNIVGFINIFYIDLDKYDSDNIFIKERHFEVILTLSS